MTEGKKDSPTPHVAGFLHEVANQPHWHGNIKVWRIQATGAGTCLRMARSTTSPKQSQKPFGREGLKAL
jgi:hypothetical protein